MQKISKLEKQAKELQAEREVLQKKLQEKTEEMKGIIIKNQTALELQWGKFLETCTGTEYSSTEVNRDAPVCNS